jgi:hypothetical protein
VRRIGPGLGGIVTAIVCFAIAFAAVWWWLGAPARFALRLVDAARAPAGVPEAMVDAEMVERLRRIELVRRLASEEAPAPRIADALRGEAGPDAQYPTEERARRQRERAARGVAATLSGACTAARAPTLARRWVERVTSSAEALHLPAEAVAEQRALAHRLARAEGVIVKCDKGSLGVLVTRSFPLGCRVADLMPMDAPKAPLDPTDPGMK